MNSLFCVPVILKYEGKIDNNHENRLIKALVLACKNTIIFTALLYMIKNNQAFECTGKHYK